MKIYLPFLSVIFLILLFSCENSFTQQIEEMHADARSLGDTLEIQLEELSMQANSINVQGRALSPGEIDFTGKVSALQISYNQWQQSMEKAEGMPMEQERLDLEKSLLGTARELNNLAEDLAKRPVF